MANQRVPWLFLEPDCCPLKAGWLDAIEAEYKTAGKPFMGARVEVNEVPLHMSGNGVYPADMFQHGGNALIAGDIAWDVAAASQIVPQAHFTKLILHNWKHEPFANQSEVDNLLSNNSEAQLFHSDKTPSLIERLRERKNNLPVPVQAEPTETVEIANGTIEEGEARESNHPDEANRGTGRKPDFRGGQFICDLFLKSYPKDYEWMSYCVRSIDKFCSGFREVIIIAPDDKCPVPNYPHRLMVEPEAPGINGYLWQGAVKAIAHRYTNAPFILHCDSDCLFTRPVTPETFFMDGKPFWLYVSYDAIEVPWKPITEKFIGHPVEFEWMRRLPCIVPRNVHVELERFCLAKHNKTVQDYVMQQPGSDWSEFNSLGAIAWDKFHDEITWINCQ